MFEQGHSEISQKSNKILDMEKKIIKIENEIFSKNNFIKELKNQVKDSDIVSSQKNLNRLNEEHEKKVSEFKKNEDGVWEATAGPINPGAYRYQFMVDEVSVIDPRNPSISESNGNAWSLVYIPGAEFMGARKVPHGAVAAVHYYSTSLGRHRRMHIYTPPGYESGNAKYPVFYLKNAPG